MLSKTVIAIRAVLDIDPSITEEHREGIMQFVMDDSLTVANILREQSGNEVVSIEKAAKILGKSKPTIERYIKSGHLTPICPSLPIFCPSFVPIMGNHVQSATIMLQPP